MDQRPFLDLRVFAAIFALSFSALAGEAPPASVAKEATDPFGFTAFGQRGIYRGWAASTYEPFALLAGWSFEFFAIGDYLTEGDDESRFGARFAVALVPIQGLEIATGFSFSSNRNSSFEPIIVQSIGDPFLSLRYGRAVTKWLALGGGVQMLLPSSADSFSVAWQGSSFKFALSSEFRPTEAFSILVSGGYHLDRSSSLTSYLLEPSQLFGANINPHDQIFFFVGGAYQLGPVAPFLEFGTAQAMGADLAFGDNPGWLTLGVRAWPLSDRRLHLVAAVDVGLMGIHAPAGKARTPPYTVILAVAYDFATKPGERVVEVAGQERVREVQVPAPPKPEGVIVGQILDAGSGQPLVGARIRIGGASPMDLMADLEEGRFRSCPLPPGPVKVIASLDGFTERTEVVLVQDKAESPLLMRLDAVTGKTFGRLKGIIRSATGKPIEAKIVIPARKAKGDTDAHGAFEFQQLETGVFDVLISASGFVTQRKKVELKSGDIVILNVELYPK